MTDLSDDRLLGVADLAAILGKSKRTVGGWRSRGVVCDTELKVDDRGTLIWRASTVLAGMRDKGYYDGPVPDPMPLPDLVSYQYVQDVTGKDRRSVQWLRDARSGVQLPDPAVTVSNQPLWSRDVIDRWHDEQKVTA